MNSYLNNVDTIPVPEWVDANGCIRIHDVPMGTPCIMWDRKLPKNKYYREFHGIRNNKFVCQHNTEFNCCQFLMPVSVPMMSVQ